jgi:hypothetical protein
MNNEDKILELLSEALQKLDKVSAKQDEHTKAIQNNTHRIDTLVSVVARQNTALQNLARDVHDLENFKFDVEVFEIENG